MKLTSEEFNAIFTFYDKVRERTVWVEKREAHPSHPTTTRMLTWSSEVNKLWEQRSGPCSSFLSLWSPCSILPEKINVLNM